MKRFEVSSVMHHRFANSIETVLNSCDPLDTRKKILGMLKWKYSEWLLKDKTLNDPSLRKEFRAICTEFLNQRFGKKVRKRKDLHGQKLLFGRDKDAQNH